MAIRTSRKSGFIQRNGVMRRETVWFQFPFVNSTLAASATAVIQTSLNAAALLLRPFTVVRTRMQLLVLSDQSAATEIFIGNYGMCVVSDQATAIGVSAVPTPATDQGSDLWFLIEAVINEFKLIGTDVIAQSGGSKAIDSKAMRKVDIGQDIVTVAEAGIGESGCRVLTTGRMLVKLH